jgi:monoamine oxidase
MIYDVVILGGGIGGIYTVYKLNRCSPHLKILLLEKENYLGGRVFTVHQGDVVAEAGAGRFGDNHRYFMALLKELKLMRNLIENGTDVAYAPANYGSGAVFNSVNDAARFTEKTGCASPVSLVNNVLTLALGKSTLPNAGLVARVVAASKFESKTYLQNQSFETYAKKVLTLREVEFIKESFGYYSELVVMNAYDATQLMVVLSPQNTFYSLKGGLSHVIDRMVADMESNPNVRILLQHAAKKIIPVGDEPHKFEIVCTHKERTIHYLGKKCVCALPKQALLTLSIFNPIKKLLHAVEYGKLCRIYCKFDVNKSTGKVWFHGLPKLTTNNHLRMVIPYNESTGVIMLSYTDNKFADYWQQLYASADNHKEGIRRVNKKLIQQIGEVIGPEITVPMPKYTRICYWKHGVGYWGVGSDSATVAQKMIRPFPEMDLFVCGENYSEKWQQWMEGALETSERVLRLL